MAESTGPRAVDTGTLPEYHAGLHALWQSRRGGRVLPAWRAFDVLELAPWLGWLHLVEVLPGHDYRWAVYGSSVASIYNREWNGRRFSDVAHANPASLFAWYDACVAERRPLLHRHDIDNEGRPVRWSRLFLPLGDDGAVVDRVIVHSHLLSPLN